MISYANAVMRTLPAVLAAGLSLWSSTAPGSETASAQPEQSSKWDVSSPDFSAPSSTVALDLTQGTWMSLDVSPDGTTIVFDLLGDIYTLPITGGMATNISSGLQWDMQPRYSPNGRQIAFTSDRAGGDNIWVMNADGSNPRAITKETFRLLNNPAWSPDGLYLAARKHFTTQRSLGAGEIWLYHTQGGSGIKVVKRPNEQHQKELGEPVFAPDGDGIYFSQNITPGGTFEYAQDTNGEVFRIRYVDLETGDIRDIAGGPGGAVRPTPSPDGRYLAFVRRVRAQSMLFLKDLTTGNESLLTDMLDQDMQEAWAVHGVYPNMDWTPDSASIVFWAKGGLHSINIADRRIEPIEFQIRDERTVYEPPHYRVDVAPPMFDTKMVRWAQTASSSGAVVFESLGRLYVKDSPQSDARRLTRSDDDNFELYPTLGPDGRWVYFVAWNDQALGTIMRVPLRGGKAKRLTRTPGHYRELSVSADGATLAFRKSTGGGLLSDVSSANPGVYVMPAQGGESSLVTRTGTQPHFAQSLDRLYMTRRDGTDRVLVSTNLDGTDERKHAKTSWSAEMSVSPSGSHLAYRENYHVFVAPLPRVGAMVDLTGGGTALPVVRVSATGGRYVGWSRNGDSVYWSVGPEFKITEVQTIHDEAFEPPATGQDLSMSVPYASPTGQLVLHNARIVTMAGSVIEQGYVVVEGNRIKAVQAGPAPASDLPGVDLGGKTLLPGLVDIHAHGPYAQEDVIPQQNWSALAHLALGVTTVHDPSSSASAVFSAAEYARAGRILSPRTYSTGEIVYGAKSGFWAKIDSLDDALAHARRLKAQGAIALKNYNQPRRAQRQQVVEAARQNELMVVAEGGSLYHMDLNLVADGNTGIEHTLPQLAIYDDVVQFWAGTRVGYTPTLVVGYGTISGEDYWYQHSEVWKHPLLSRYVPPKRLQARAVRRQMAPDSDHQQPLNAAIGKQLADAGVSVHTGAHGQREGLATHWEMWMFEQGGMSPLEALEAATIAPARYLGLDQDIGSIAVGKLADMIVVDGDVTEDIRLSDQVTHVMLNGRLYQADNLEEMLTGNHRLQPFYWEGRPESDYR